MQNGLLLILKTVKARAIISHFINTKHLPNENLKFSSYLFICEYHIALSYYMYVSYHETQDPLLHLLLMLHSSCILIEIKSLKCLTLDLSNLRQSHHWPLG